MKKENILSIIELLCVIIFFVVATFFAQKYAIEIKNSIGGGISGILLYIAINIFAVILAPISTLPLIPIASGMWGWFWAGIFSIIGWVVGAQIAFYISRRFGKPLVKKFVSLDKIGKIEDKIPEKNIFWTVVLLRMIIPVDLLSYGLGLFSKIKSIPFLFSTIFGVMPFAFIFAYVGTLSIKIQIIIGIEIMAAILVMLLYKKSSAKKILVLIAVLSVSLTLFVYKSEILLLIQNLKEISIQKPLFTALVLILSKTVLTPLGFPGTPLTLLSGSLFGKFFGTVIALIGNTLGATLAFLFSRYVFREYVQNKVLPKYPRILKYEKRFEQKALATVVLLRLIPVFPFNGLNFLLGVLNIPLRKYVFASFIGMIPGTALFVYFGESLGSMSLVNILIAIGGILLLTYIGKKI
ncbi:hypothetical protein COW99_06255 [Candidatus Roizmanbacteria bacterium CG22_combo_CG10-13_8_21_14_all_38_20]|uniref:TVP38/TMEM64 family membrane protein n=1 Tax=Candidatus Roizmanbacteria bacterium CG22_combo_CG10-13_8_21_14_all_38_20 TaxID=1974862 RepID=A0A2H0BU36_9BACT|nr:MAG: hypothetical protein COW99_06255 [Candidatus Roizmanbacteria bacterium CG22_combo_CG10-13_8_21_14_all_38_20]